MSEEFPQFPNAPIVEAIVSFDCEDTEAELPKAMEAAEEQFGDRFSRLEKRHHFKGEFHLPEKGEVLHDVQSEITGFLVADDEPATQVLQFEREGFIFNQLAPYQSFDDCLSLMKEGWEFYRSQFQPDRLKGLSMRYVNRIEVPLEKGQVGLGQYFTHIPKTDLPEGQALAGIFQSFQMICEETGSVSRVTLSTEESENGLLPMILDLECSLAKHDLAASFEELLPNLEQLRALKNQVFHNSIEEQCHELFK